MLSHDNQRWLDEFISSNGRPPKILHLGNIANNAYNNAKLMNQAGIDSDVICYDYYHIMACPEWEDADISYENLDHFRPDWTSIDLHGFKRPSWFAQGPLDLCVKYLIANARQDNDKYKLWDSMLVVSLLKNARDYASSTQGYLFFKSAIKRIVPRYIRIQLVKTALRIYYTFIGYDYLSATIKREYREEFEDRQDRMEFVDYACYLPVLDLWKDLFSYYDYIIAYSTDPIIPMLCRVPYFAFEHGTIRDIPYEESSQGRLASLSYRLANHVFVTNFDCIDSAQYLSQGKYSVINHPYDEDHGLSVGGWEETRSKIQCDLDCDFIFFHPTRHDWVEGHGYADKSNDIFLKAFAELRNSGHRVGLVSCSWGSNVEQSKELIHQFECDSYVKWVPPQAITPFERLCLASDIVVDQFKLGAFGGVVFKAMAVGTPILTYLDEARLLQQYPECPTVINCKSTDEIVDAAIKLSNAPENIKKLGQQSRQWMKKYHAKESTVNVQVDQFRITEPANTKISV